MYNKYLPIGTVVLLKGGKKRVMITGFCCIETKTNKMYDYTGCLYPEGYVSKNKMLLFNHSQIAQIYYMGLSDNEDKQFKQTLATLVNQYNNRNNNQNNQQ